MPRLIDADLLEKEIYKWMPKDMESWADGPIPPIEDLVVSIMMTIQEQPTVNQWIPCSERLPKKSDRGFIVSVAKKYRWLGYSVILIHESSVLINGYKDGFYEAWQKAPKPFEVIEE